MTTPRTAYRRVPRETLAARLDALPLGKAQAYAAFIRRGDPGGLVPCWGAITQRFVEAFPGDDDRLAVLDQLVKEGDRRPLYLFLETSRARPRLLAALCQRAAELPVAVQRALVAMPEAATFVARALDALSPEARRVWDGGEDLKRVERELLGSRVAELTAFQYFLPDAVDPRQEHALRRTSAPSQPRAPAPLADALVTAITRPEAAVTDRLLSAPTTEPAP